MARKKKNIYLGGFKGHELEIAVFKSIPFERRLKMLLNFIPYARNWDKIFTKVEKKVKIILVFLLLAGSIIAADINELLYKSQSAIEKNDYKTAISYLKDAIKIDKKSYEANFLLGLSLYRTLKYQESIKYLETAFEIKESYETGFLLADSLQKKIKITRNQ